MSTAALDARAFKIVKQEAKTFAVSTLAVHPKNPREHDVGSIHTSIKDNGFFGGVIVWKHRKALLGVEPPKGKRWILIGAGRFEQSVELGAREIPGWEVDVSAARARAMLLADNKASDGAGYRDDALLALLKQAIDDEGGNVDAALHGSLYDGDDVDDLIAKLEQSSASGADGDDDHGASFNVFDRDVVADAAFAHFREAGFPYRKLALHVQMQEINALAELDQDQALRSTLGYQVADTYHPHRFHASAQGKKSPYASFMIDKSLKHAIKLALDSGAKLGDSYFGALSLVLSTQACSNFRPAFAMHLYRRFAKSGAVVLDPSTGYGGRLVGWIASQLGGKYIGVDPNVDTSRGNIDLARALGVASRVTINEMPFEDVDWAKLGMKSAVDFAFTSPPYFAKELYSTDESQSYKRYPTFDEWRAGFLAKLFDGMMYTLKPGARALINIADVTIKGTRYGLEDACVDEAATAGFDLEDTLRFEMTTRMGANQDDEIATEPVFVFRKQ